MQNLRKSRRNKCSSWWYIELVINCHISYVDIWKKFEVWLSDQATRAEFDQFIGFIHYFSNFNRVKISKKKKESKMGSKATSKLSPTCAGESWWLRKHQVIKWCRSGLFSRRNWNWSHLWAWGWVHNEVNCSSLGGNRTMKSVPCQRAMIDTFAFTGTWWPMPWPIQFNPCQVSCYLGNVSTKVSAIVYWTRRQVLNYEFHVKMQFTT